MMLASVTVAILLVLLIGLLVATCRRDQQVEIKPSASEIQLIARRHQVRARMVRIDHFMSELGSTRSKNH